MLGQNPQLIEFLECRPPPLQTPSGKCAKDLFATYLPSPDMWWPSRRKRSGCLSTLGWWWWSSSAWCTWCSSSASSSTSRTTGAISSSRTSRWATRPKWSKLYIIVVFFFQENLDCRPRHYSKASNLLHPQQKKLSILSRLTSSYS